MHTCKNTNCEETTNNAKEWILVSRKADGESEYYCSEECFNETLADIPRPPEEDPELKSLFGGWVPSNPQLTPESSRISPYEIKDLIYRAVDYEKNLYVANNTLPNPHNVGELTQKMYDVIFKIFNEATQEYYKEEPSQNPNPSDELCDAVSGTDTNFNMEINDGRI